MKIFKSLPCKTVFLPSLLTFFIFCGTMPVFSLSTEVKKDMEDSIKTMATAIETLEAGIKKMDEALKRDFTLSAPSSQNNKKSQVSKTSDTKAGFTGCMLPSSVGETSTKSTTSSTSSTSSTSIKVNPAKITPTGAAASTKK